MDSNNYEPIALEQYQKYMSSINKPVKVFKSGLVISMDAPYLVASPDDKVINPGCSDPFGLSEVKCPETKYLVTPLDASSDSSFFMEDVEGKPRLKRTHKYYVQVQGLMGVISLYIPVKKWASSEFHLTLNFGIV